jgi:hypothetical protein
VLTCYGAPGTTPANKYLLNASGMTPTTTTPLSINGFTSEINGNLDWTTVPSENSASCTLIDEFGGTLPSTITQSSFTIQTPITGLPSSASGYVLPIANSCAIEFATPQLIPDTLTLTCSDPTFGTAVAQTVWNGAACGG